MYKSKTNVDDDADETYKMTSFMGLGSESDEENDPMEEID